MGLYACEKFLIFLFQFVKEEGFQRKIANVFVIFIKFAKGGKSVFHVCEFI